ncbi:MAG TPA: ABC transporter ATP-binding protein [Burkholderiales bacterium]|nr:ABC transporter ATP-binding protein [Burkholderiales bacterium]
MLEVRDLHAYYGKSHILQGVRLHVAAGECVSLIGRNGVGRSTTIKAVMGMVEGRGSVRFKGEEILGLATFAIAQRGIGYVPESRDVFPTLTVTQNLELGRKSRVRAPRWSIEDVFALFPLLRERRDTQAGVLSGGEQQMLALARTLMGDPDLVMIDEPTEGLAPRIVELVADLFREIKRRGVALLLVEQKLAIALELSERLYVMGHGRIVFAGSPAELRANAAIRREWLEV